MTDGSAELLVTSRRRLLALAAASAAAGVAVAAGVGAQPAAAGNNMPINLATTNVADAGNVSNTLLNYTLTTTNTNTRHLFVVSDVTAGFSPSASGTGRIHMKSNISQGPPATGSFTTGEILCDATPNLWMCSSGGAASTWRRFAFVDEIPSIPAPVTPAPIVLPPQLHIVEPTRVFDSGLPSFPAGRITTETSNTVNVANGIDLTSGNVAVADVVPAGATANQFTLTIDQAPNNGFLAVTPGDSTKYKASTINWSSTTPNIATGSLCKLDGARNLKIYCGGGGSTHYIVDVTGYYL